MASAYRMRDSDACRSSAIWAAYVSASPRSFAVMVSPQALMIPAVIKNAMTAAAARVIRRKSDRAKPRFIPQMIPTIR